MTDNQNFYPRSPCGERRLNGTAAACVVIFLSTLSLRRATTSFGALKMAAFISIHALLAESDSGVKVFRRGNDLFLSTLSLRRATKEFYHRRRKYLISIHALLAESDL